ncbi:MAG: adenylate kinase [Oscillospiraceae bacterium]
MVVLLAGASHTGKTLLAQRLLEKYKMPYLSIDHLKMGLIRSGNTALTPQDDEELTAYLWPIVREMVKTAIENRQDLTVEGCYIPFGWRADFEEAYLPHIRYCCLVMSQDYIRTHFEEIRRHACDIEARRDGGDCAMEELLAENAANLALCQEYGCGYILIDGEYQVDITL